MIPVVPMVYCTWFNLTVEELSGFTPNQMLGHMQNTVNSGVIILENMTTFFKKFQANVSGLTIPMKKKHLRRKNIIGREVSAL